MKESEAGLLVGITGGIACGKSEVGKIFESCGFHVLDTDVVCHELIEGDAEVRADIKDMFAECITQDGEISRVELGQIVFTDAEAMQCLNRILHPPARKLWREWAAKMRSEERRAAVLMPLLFEIEEVDLWDAVVVVTSRRDLVLKRLVGRGLKESEASLRIDAQMPNHEKEKRADHVIENNGSIQELKSFTLQTICRVMEQRGEE